MQRHRIAGFRILTLISGLWIAVATTATATGEPTPQAASAFRAYVDSAELRLAQQHRAGGGFLTAGVPLSWSRLSQGELIVQQITPSGGSASPGALLHDWRGTAFVRGAKAADFERLMRDVNAFPRRFSPQVLQARVLMQKEDRMRVQMRVRQRHVLTVILDTTYEITFVRSDPQHGFSMARSTRISEIQASGTAAERLLSSQEEHGFLWRLNTYWSYEERDGGLYLQIETISLTRSVPHGLGWAVQPLIESIPRESLEFTLQSARNALRDPK